jgi:hypothetical protein
MKTATAVKWVNDARQQASGNDVASLLKELSEKPKAAPAGMHEPMGDMDF